MTPLINSFSAQTYEQHQAAGSEKIIAHFAAQVTEVHTEHGRAKIVEQFSVAPSGSDIMGVSTPEYEPANNEILRYHGNG